MRLRGNRAGRGRRLPIRTDSEINQSEIKRFGTNQFEICENAIQRGSDDGQYGTGQSHRTDG